MKSLPKRSCAGAAVFLLCGFGFCGATSLQGLAVAPETVVVSTLDVRSDSPRATRVQLQSAARLDYHVSRPEPHLVAIELYGADTSALAPEYRPEHGLVAAIVVKPAVAGQNAARLDVTLREACEVRSYLRDDAKTLVIEFEPAQPTAETKSPTGGGTAATETEDARPAATPPVQPVVYRPAGATRAGKPSGAKSPVLHALTLTETGRKSVAELKLTAKTKYNHFLLQNPTRLVIDLFDAAASVEKRTLSGDGRFVSRIRVGEPDGRTTRVVFDLKQVAPYTVAESETGLVVRFADEPADAAAAPPPAAMPTVKDAPKDEPTVPSAAKTTAETASPTTAVADGAETPTPKRAAAAKPEPAALTVPAARRSTAEPPAKEPSKTAAKAGTTPAPANAAAPVAGRKPQSGRGAQFGDPSYQGDPISLDITNVDLSDILRFISDNYDVNFVLDKSVTKVPVTLKVNQVPWTQVLESIFRANQLTYRREGMIVRVATIAAITAEEQNLRNQRLQEIYSAPTVTEYFKLKYERVDQNAAQQQGGGAGGVGLQSPSGQPIGGILGGIGFVGIVQQALSPAGRISINPRTNTVIITDIPSYLEQVRDVIARLDVPEPQVEIEARIVFASRNFARELGVQLFAAALTRQGRAAAFSTSAGTFLDAGREGATDSLIPGLLIGPRAAPGISGGGSSVLGLTTGPIGTGILSATLTANEQKGIAKSIAAPRVTVLNNAQATIASGTQIPFIATAGVGVAQTVTFVNATIGLTITPQITTEGNVLLTVSVTNDAPGQVINGFTSISRRTATTQVIVPDGGTTIIGGVLNDIETSDVFRTPGISSLPLLGELFKRRALSRTTGELLFFITPRIGRGENILSGGEPPVSPQPAAGGQP